MPKLKNLTLWESLAKETYRFSLHQAISIAEAKNPQKAKIGPQFLLSTSPLQLCSSIYLAFPPNDLLNLKIQSDVSPRIYVNFMGIAGIQGTLPLPFTEYILERIQAKDFALRDFLDVFNHRILSLFHYERSRVFLGLTHRADNSYSDCIKDLLGQQKQAFPGLHFYAPLFWQQPRSAEGLKVLLSHYFQCTVSIHSFKGSWHTLGSQYQARLGQTTLNFQKGLGHYCWIQNRGIEIHLHHLSRKQFYGFLPKGFLHQSLKAFIERYIGLHHTFVLYIHSKPLAISRMRLNYRAQLGWDSFLRLKRHKPMTCTLYCA